MAITRPVNLQKPFAADGGKNEIPVASQIGINNGAASYTDGFPPLTRTPIAAGGIPPKGLDMNGVLFEVSSHTVFQNAGGQYRFDAALAAAVGGYPKGAVLQSDDGLSSYVSMVDGNEDNFNTDPEAAGVAWLPYAGAALRTGLPGATFTEISALTENDGPIICTDIGGAVYIWGVSSYVPLMADEAHAGSLKISTTALAQGLVDDATALTPLKLAAALDVTALGRGQTWQDVTASRTMGVTYTNSTGKPIVVHITGRITAGAGTVGCNIAVDGYTLPGGMAYGNSAIFAASVVVPNGRTYSAAVNAIVGTYDSIKWSELRT